MNMKKTAISAGIGLALGSAAFSANAALTSSAVLDFTLGTQQITACNYGTAAPCNKASYQITDVVGSYFVMDTNGNGVEASEKTPIGSLNGIHIGTTQSASGSHAGGINGTENPDIDNPWTFFGGTGMHQTTSPISVLTGLGTSVKTLDMSGWNVTWNGIASIPLTQQMVTGVVVEVDASGNPVLDASGNEIPVLDASGNQIPTFADTVFTITCDQSSCSDSSNYTADGLFHVAGAGFTTVAYTLHLEGHISNVPVPAAVWLFGSGLLGLVGVARRKKAK